MQQPQPYDKPQTLEIPLVGQGDWSNITYESICRDEYGITTPDGKQLNEQQVCAVLLMETWYLERADFFETPIGQYLLAEIEEKAYESEQEFSFSLSEWFASDFTLVGFAGTGKSSSFQAFVARIKKQRHILMTIMAPTNKAVKVMKAFGKSSNITGVDYQTIHQALGLKMEVDDDGREVSKADPNGKQNLDEYDLGACDEGSMANQEIYTRVSRLTRRPKMIWMGDSKQLKPVGDREISPVFRNVLATYTLSKVMRYPEGSAIAKLVTAVRDNVGHSDWIDPTEYADGESVIVTDNEDFLDMFIEDLRSDRYQDNPDSIKAICYTNKVVDWINNYAHEKLYGTSADAFIPGERLVSTKPVQRKRIGGMDETILKNRFEVDCLRAMEDALTWSNSDSLEMFAEHVASKFPEVVEVEQKGKTLKVPTANYLKTLQVAAKPFKYWQVRASVLDEDRRVNLNLIDPSERQRYNAVIDTLRLIALHTPNRSHVRKVAWAIMYKFIRNFDPVVHSYAITCHSAQGSSYENVYVTERDILRCKDKLELSQLKYVAYSRVMQKLVISL